MQKKYQSVAAAQSCESISSWKHGELHGRCVEMLTGIYQISTVLDWKAYFHDAVPNVRDFSLYQLIKDFEHCKSSDPRDMIFALYSIASGTSRFTLDYSMSAEELLYDTREKTLALLASPDNSLWLERGQITEILCKILKLGSKGDRLREEAWTIQFLEALRNRITKF
jgi:hypothetical protein